MVFTEKRTVKKYCAGEAHCHEDKAQKIETLVKTLADCSGVLTLRVGEAPKKRMAEAGIPVFTTYDRIEDAVRKAAKGGM